MYSLCVGVRAWVCLCVLQFCTLCVCVCVFYFASQVFLMVAVWSLILQQFSYSALLYLNPDNDFGNTLHIFTSYLAVKHVQFGEKCDSVITKIKQSATKQHKRESTFYLTGTHICTHWHTPTCGTYTITKLMDDDRNDKFVVFQIATSQPCAV